jgi:hypothetical protein
MKHKTITLILSALRQSKTLDLPLVLNIYTQRSLSLDLVYPIFITPDYIQNFALPSFSLWMHPLESIPSPCPMSSLVVRPHVGHHLPQPAWVCCMSLTKSDGEREKDTCRQQTYNTKQKSWGWEDCTFLMGNVSAYLSQSGYFIGQYKEKTQVKIKL